MVITLIGSTKFREAFEKANIELTFKGHSVFTVCLFGHEIGLDMSGPQKKLLDRVHFDKIKHSDAVYVVNPGGYMGLSTCDELHYAIALGKDIMWLEEPLDFLVSEYDDIFSTPKEFMETVLKRTDEHFIKTMEIIFITDRNENFMDLKIETKEDGKFVGRTSLFEVSTKLITSMVNDGYLEPVLSDFFNVTTKLKNLILEK